MNLEDNSHRCIEPRDVMREMRAEFLRRGIDDSDLEATIASICFNYAQQERRRMREIWSGVPA